MKTVKLSIFFGVALLVMLQGCGSLNSTSGDRSITYNHDYNTMVETVEQAIRGSALEINFAQESDDGNKYTIVFNSSAYMNDESVQQDEGEAIVERIDDQKTRVIINNPEYHFSVPSHQRKEYDRILKNRIDSILEN